MRHVVLAGMLWLVGCTRTTADALREVERAERETGALAPAELGQARREVAAAEAADNGTARAEHVRAALALVEAGRRAAAERADVARAEGLEHERRRVERRVDVAVEQAAMDVHANPRVRSATPVPARSWSVDALEEALAMGARPVVVDVGDERRCQRARLVGALCTSPAGAGQLLLPPGREVVVMGDGERAEDPRLSEALVAMQAAGIKGVGVFRGGMKEWRADARAWVGSDRVSPETLRAFTVAELADAARPDATAGAWQLLDARTEPMFRAGHLAGAVNVPMGAITEWVARLPRGARVLVMGADEPATLEAARRAMRAEGRSVGFLVGGVNAAVMAGIPLVRGEGGVMVAQGGVQ